MRCSMVLILRPPHWRDSGVHGVVKTRLWAASASVSVRSCQGWPCRYVGEWIWMRGARSFMVARNIAASVASAFGNAWPCSAAAPQRFTRYKRAGRFALHSA